LGRPEQRQEAPAEIQEPLPKCQKPLANCQRPLLNCQRLGEREEEREKHEEWKLSKKMTLEAQLNPGKRKVLSWDLKK
jgi:hypothetical protein